MKTIAIIDDQYFVVESLKRLLKKEGYNVISANNGYEGILLIRNYIPDLIVMDLNMPIMDGFEAIRKIKQDKILTKVPIIVLTAFGDIEYIIEISKLGVTDYVIKPYRQEDLLKRIKRALGEIPAEEKPQIKIEKISGTQKILRKTIIGKGIVFKKIPIDEARAKMVLATDLKLNPQMVLLPKGTILTNELIEKLKRLKIPSIEIAVDEVKEIKGGDENGAV